MPNMIDLSKLSKEQLANLAASAFNTSGDEPKKAAKKGLTYGGVSMAEMLNQFQNSAGAEDMLEQYGRKPEIRWGY